MTQHSEGLVCLTVNYHHFLIGLEKKKQTRKLISTQEASTQGNLWNEKHYEQRKENARVVFNRCSNQNKVVKAYTDGLTFVLQPLLRVKVCDLPPRQEGITDIQAHLLQTGQLCTLQ